MPGENTTSGSAPGEKDTDVQEQEAGTSTAAGEDVKPESSPGGSEGSESPISDQQQFQENLQEVAHEAAAEGNTDADTDDGDTAGTDNETADGEGDQTGETSDESTAGESEEDDGSDLTEGQRVPYDRFRKVLGERNEVRQERDQYYEGHQQWQQVRSFMQENELEDQEVANAFKVLALAKQDPAQARQELQQMMDQLGQQTGEVLPEDLQTDVDDGLISEERAQELAKHRNESQRERNRRERTEQQQREAQERQARDQQVQEQRQAIDQWESRIQENDPDYPRIQEWVIKELRLRAQDNPPQSKEEAVKLAQNAYDTVKKSLRSIAGGKPEIQPNDATTRSGSTSAAGPEPGSIEEAALQAARE
jgi:hypothetical protein